jgi:hypothetical protein
MSAGIGPHKPSEPGYIVAWHSKKEFRAGKYPDLVMSYGEAVEQARRFSEKNPALTFWAEPAPEPSRQH